MFRKTWASGPQLRGVLTVSRHVLQTGPVRVPQEYSRGLSLDPASWGAQAKGTES